MPGPSLMPLRFGLSPLASMMPPCAGWRRFISRPLKRTARPGFPVCWPVSNLRGTGNLKWPGNRITDIGVQIGSCVCTEGNWINKF